MCVCAFHKRGGVPRVDSNRDPIIGDGHERCMVVGINFFAYIFLMCDTSFIQQLGKFQEKV